MERATQAVPHMTQELAITGQPLVIKGVDRIEAIVLTGEDVRQDAVLYTHVFSRLMRRDFNMTSVKLFWYAKGYTRRNTAKQMLADLAAEAQVLEDMAHPYEMPQSVAPAATCRMRIISDEAGLMFSAIVQTDRALHKLIHSPMSDVAEDNVAPFLRAFAALRRQVFGFYAAQRNTVEQPSPDPL